MKELFKPITTILTGDATLVGLVGYTEAKLNIRRGFVQGDEWTKLVTYYFQPEITMDNFSPNIREVPLIARVYDKEDDLNCDDMSERVIALLDNADLSVSGEVFCYNCTYAGDLVKIHWNKEKKSYDRAVRFIVRFRVEAA